MMRDRRRSRRGGFTLLEVLVSLAILSGVLVVGYRVMSGSVEAVERAERWTKATLLGEALLRESVPKYPEVGESGDKFPPPNEAWSWKVSVKESPYSGVRAVDVTVTYEAGEPRESVTVTGVAYK